MVVNKNLHSCKSSVAFDYNHLLQVRASLPLGVLDDE